MILPRAVRDAIVAHAHETAPAECCGMLVGTAGSIVAAVRASNLSEDPARYLIDPRDHIRARREARACLQDVIGFYHSHPDSHARPSPTDLAEASYPDSLYLIVGVINNGPDVRLYRFDGKAFEAIAIEIGP